jgi:hypothetical protein
MSRSARWSVALSMAGLTLLVTVLAPAPAIGSTGPTALSRPGAGHPVRFIANEGQFAPDVAFHAPTALGSVSVTRRAEMVYAVPAGPVGGRGTIVRETAVGARAPRLRGDGEATQVSWFIGSDPARWRAGLSGYPIVQLGELWPGVEGRLVARGATVEKIFEVRPGADPRRIALRLDLPRSAALGTARVNDRGELEVRGDGSTLTFSAPVAYQERDGMRVNVPVRYEVRRVASAAGPGLTYGFAVGAYDRNAPLTIDPVLASTLIGGRGPDRAYGVAVYPLTGSVFITGVTYSADYPTTAGALRGEPLAGAQAMASDVVISKLNADLTRLLASTYLGGLSNEEGNGIVVDRRGQVYVAGWTNSPDFPRTHASPYRGGKRDGFVVKLDNDLSRLDASRFLGGAREDVAQAIALHDRTETVYITGWTQSSDFMHDDPVGADWHHRHGDSRANYDVNDQAFVATLWARDLSGEATAIINGHDHDRGLAITPGACDIGRSGTDPATCARLVVVGGATASAGGGDLLPEVLFPTTQGAVESSARSGGWVVVLAYDLSGMDASTMLAGRGPHEQFDTAVRGVAVTEDGEIVVAGYVWGCGALPTTVGAYAPECVDHALVAQDGFVVKLSGALDEVLAGTYLGGRDRDFVMGMVRQQTAQGGYEIFVAGYTYSTDFPTTANAHDTTPNGGVDAFVAKLSDNLSVVLASTYLGGAGGDYGMAIATNAERDVYVAGYTYSADFPTTVGAFDQTLGGSSDAFVTRLTPALNAKR